MKPSRNKAPSEVFFIFKLRKGTGRLMSTGYTV